MSCCARGIDMSAVLDKYGCENEDSGFICSPHGCL